MNYAESFLSAATDDSRNNQQVPESLAHYSQQISGLYTRNEAGSRRSQLREREQRLGRQIQDGKAAEGLFALHGKEIDSELTESLRQEITESREAITEFTMSNLPFAQYMAKLSIGNTEVILSVNDRLPGFPLRRIAGLASPNAMIEDRVQLANIALLRAVEQWQPDQMDESGRQARFATFAGTVIYRHLAREIPQIEHRGLRLPYPINEQLSTARIFPEKFTPENLETLGKYFALSQGESLDDLKLYTSSDNEAGETEYLDPTESIAEHSTASAENQLLLRLSLNKMLTGVFVPSGNAKRDKEILRMSYGLIDGETHTKEEVAAKFGVVKKHIYHIEAVILRAMYKKYKQHKDDLYSEHTPTPAYQNTLDPLPVASVTTYDPGPRDLRTEIDQVFPVTTTIKF